MPPDLPVAAASDAAIRQVLECAAGQRFPSRRGTVTLSGHEAGDALAIDVTDEGSGIADATALFQRRAPGPPGTASVSPWPEASPRPKVVGCY